MALVLNLPEDSLERLETKARILGLTREQYAERLLETDVRPVNRPSIADRISQIWAELPEEALAALPADGADQHDHYIYGTAKRQNP